MLGLFASSTRRRPAIHFGLSLASLGLLACMADVDEPGLGPPVLPCDLDHYRWKIVGEEKINCSASEWLLIPADDGRVDVLEYGCASLRGQAFRVDDDVQVDVSGGGYDVQLLIHTSSGQCERIPVSWMHLPDSKITGSGDTLEFVRVRPR